MNSAPDHSTTALARFQEILGPRHVLTSPRRTAPYAQGNRYGAGAVLAVLRPGSLVEMWQALQVCLDHDLIVINQAANTGVTGGSGPGELDYDREIVIISTLRINGIHLVNENREAVCLAGATLYELTELLAAHDREPHSVIGSSSVGATVVGGIANNSGGSQIRKGPAYTEHALYARVDEQGRAHLVNHLGIELGTDPTEILERVQRGDWDPALVTPPPEDTTGTDYAEHVRQIVDTPARYNADPKFLHEASGSAGKLMVFAVRVRTFPLEKDPATFYIGASSPDTLEDLRRAFLTADRQLPISGEYLGREAFQMALQYGRDTYTALKYAGSRTQVRLFALKNWANGVFAKVPGMGPTVADTISQKLFDLLPEQVPSRLLDFRDRWEHHLILVVSGSQRQETLEALEAFFAEPAHEGDFFSCTPEEAEAATLLRFGVSSATNRMFCLRRKEFSDFASLDVALPRNEREWLAPLPEEITRDIVESNYLSHFFCHVLHADHIIRKGADPVAVKKKMTAYLEARGATLPAEHNYGRVYAAPEHLVEHYRALDPCNVFNPGVGMTSTKKNWA